MPPVKDGHQRRRLLVPATWLLRRARAHADNSSPLDLGVGHRLVVLLLYPLFLVLLRYYNVLDLIYFLHKLTAAVILVWFGTE